MRVILLRNVKSLGVKSDVKEVADGHAINFLIPQGLAKHATSSSIAEIEVEKQKKAALAKVREDLLIKNLKKIKGLTVEITEKANDKGHLFAAIHEKEIAEKLKETSGLDVEATYIKVEEPIKTVGEHEVKVVVGDKETSFKVKVLEGKEK